MHKETHPFEEFIPANATSLIIGSFPPVKLTVQDIGEVDNDSRAYYEKYFSNKRNLKTENDINFYYGSRDNLLWRDLLGVIFNCQLDTEERIKTFLIKNSIGITDIFEVCKRSLSGGKLDSFDSSLEIIKDRDVLKSIKKNKIVKVYSTSLYVTDKLRGLDDSGYLLNKIITLPSPSKSSSRSIGRLDEYKKKKSINPKYNTLDYRIEKYKEAFSV